ncbi:MAG: TonB-dependent receptor [Gammaproteobacteria bacterium]|nr:TonB-dependent receptor [Gammaproteobacteria bacterium]
MKLASEIRALMWLSGLFLAAGAFAQNEEAEMDSEESADTSFLEEIVVTGSARRGRAALETSYGVAVLDSFLIRRGAPEGLTELVDAMPGLQGEFSNGEVNSNLNVRGTQGGFMSFISLQEDGLPVQYSPFFSEFELRHDLSYDRVEAVLGGPSGIFTAQGSAATINYISRRPTSTEGEARVSVTDYGQYKMELFYGGPIGDSGWHGTIGGFFRQGDGIRDTGYTAASGGQIRASAWKEFDRGTFTIAYKKIDDAAPYYNPLPTSTIDSNSPDALVGFDARKDALAGPDVRIINSKRPGEIAPRDLSDGNQSLTDQLTLSLDYELGGNWSVSEKFRVSSIQTIAHDFRGGSDTATLLQAPAYLASQLASLQEAFPTTESVRLTRVNDGMVVANPASLNGNGLLAIHDSIEYDRKVDNFINDLRVNWENHRVLFTIGLQSWDVRSDSFNIQDQFLIDIRPNAMRYNVEALDGDGNVVGHLTDNGIITHGSLDNYGGLDIVSNNLYVNVEFSLTDSIRIDAGVREERGEMSGWGEDVSFGVPIADSLNDPLVLADNSRSITRNGDIQTGETDYDSRSYTIGGNWAVTDQLAVYARWAQAQDMAFQNEFTFFNIPGFGTAAGSNLGLTDEATELEFAEIGVRYIGDRISGFLTYFDTVHKKSGNVEVDERGVNFFVPVDTIADGVEFWLDAEVLPNFDVNFSGVVMNSEQEGAGNQSATPVPRLPETQLRLSPVLHLNKAQIFANAQYYGERWADRGDIKLPSYTQFDLGVSYDVSPAMTLTLLAKNLTDAWGFTSGNFRGPVPGATVRYNSTIPGRSFVVSASYAF